MDENKYEKLLDELKSGEIEELIVHQPEFLRFREAWLKCEDRTVFVGEAGLNGDIIYRYQSEK